MSTVKANTYQDASGGNTATINSMTPTADSLQGFRNRIINGDMRIDQRNAGASVTPTSGQYLVDRFQYQATQASKVTAQQNAGAVTPPAGFTNYLGITSSSAYSVTGNDAFQIAQTIEGFNVADLNWGTANAKTATLSFWVRSSLTGTFGGSIATNKTAVWVMPFTYTISSANTWTYITVSIPAATSTNGTNNDNSAGVFVRFGLGSAGTASGGTAGVWTNAGNYIQPSSTVSVVGTNGATFYITGVQLEVGSTATPFERRPYGTELMLCQRYYFKTFPQATAPAQNTGSTDGALFAGPSTNNVTFVATQKFSVTMRAAPTVTTFSPNAASANWTDQAGAIPTATVFNAGQEQVAIRGSGSTTAGGLHSIHLTASIEL